MVARGSNKEMDGKYQLDSYRPIQVPFEAFDQAPGFDGWKSFVE